MADISNRKSPRIENHHLLTTISNTMCQKCFSGCTAAYRVIGLLALFGRVNGRGSSTSTPHFSISFLLGLHTHCLQTESSWRWEVSQVFLICVQEEAQQLVVLRLPGATSGETCQTRAGWWFFLDIRFPPVGISLVHRAVILQKTMQNFVPLCQCTVGSRALGR